MATPSHSSQSAKQYLRTRVMTATPEQLQLMLYDGAVRFTDAARSALARRDLEAVHANVTRAQAIVTELLSGLRPAADPDLCGRLASLYQHVYRQLIRVGFDHDPHAADEALDVLRHQRETWLLLLEQMGREKAVGRVRGTHVHHTHTAGLSIAA